MQPWRLPHEDARPESDGGNVNDSEWAVQWREGGGERTWAVSYTTGGSLKGSSPPFLMLLPYLLLLSGGPFFPIAASLARPVTVSTFSTWTFPPPPPPSPPPLTVAEEEGALEAAALEFPSTIHFMGNFCEAEGPARPAPRPHIVPDLDLEQLTGLWYEIGASARYKLASDELLGTRCATHNYSISENRPYLLTPLWMDRVSATTGEVREPYYHHTFEPPPPAKDLHDLLGTRPPPLRRRLLRSRRLRAPRSDHHDTVTATTTRISTAIGDAAAAAATQASTRSGVQIEPASIAASVRRQQQAEEMETRVIEVESSTSSDSMPLLSTTDSEHNVIDGDGGVKARTGVSKKGLPRKHPFVNPPPLSVNLTDLEWAPLGVGKALTVVVERVRSKVEPQVLSWVQEMAWQCRLLSGSLQRACPLMGSRDGKVHRAMRRIELATSRWSQFRPSIERMLFGIDDQVAKVRHSAAEIAWLVSKITEASAAISEQVGDGNRQEATAHIRYWLGEIHAAASRMKMCAAVVTSLALQIQRLSWSYYNERVILGIGGPEYPTAESRFQYNLTDRRLTNPTDLQQEVMRQRKVIGKQVKTIRLLTERARHGCANIFSAIDRVKTLNGLIERHKGNQYAEAKQNSQRSSNTITTQTGNDGGGGVVVSSSPSNSTTTGDIVTTGVAVQNPQELGAFTLTMETSGDGKKRMPDAYWVLAAEEEKEEEQQEEEGGGETNMKKGVKKKRYGAALLYRFQDVPAPLREIVGRDHDETVLILARKPSLPEITKDRFLANAKRGGIYLVADNPVLWTGFDDCPWNQSPSD
ncbi:hypothetical protein CBR_g55883 [Chara braunii]|uniref:Uncharacterized protein n=1 Tax=Chara braunii TaxID=69332 RepID=A0A388MDA8_CHABU|nr:hypothetical protein CBR_g55883 [Chara braunii]|eukprot:GBG92548.1 hypothetical protein CBR_g55883 [Chara braunii]